MDPGCTFEFRPAPPTSFYLVVYSTANMPPAEIISLPVLGQALGENEQPETVEFVM
jgi:hypothetical protein